jgi:hypothetical protein
LGRGRGPPEESCTIPPAEKLRRERSNVNQAQYTQTEEFARMVEVLVERDGVPLEEAEVCVRDGDLFPLIDPGCMYPFEGQEAVRQWEDARKTLYRLHEWFAEFDDNPALLQTVSEAAERAEVMLERAKERAGGE